MRTTVIELIDLEAIEKVTECLKAHLAPSDIASLSLEDFEIFISSSNLSDEQKRFVMMRMTIRLLSIFSNSIRIADSVEAEMLISRCSIRKIAQNSQVFAGYEAVFKYLRDFVTYCFMEVGASFYICNTDEFLNNITLYYNALDNIKDFGMKCRYYEILKHFSRISEKDDFKRIVDIESKSESN